MGNRVNCKLYINNKNSAIGRICEFIKCGVKDGELFKKVVHKKQVVCGP